MKLRNDTLMLSTAVPEDLAELQELYGTVCAALPKGDPALHCPPQDLLLGKALPAEGSPESFELLCVRVNDILVGFVMLRRDFPAKAYVEILSLCIGEAARGFGCGTRTVKMLCRYFCQSGYAAMRAATHVCTDTLPPSPEPLRFWHRLGFDRILSVTGYTPSDPDLTDSAAAPEPIRLVLENRF